MSIRLLFARFWRRFHETFYFTLLAHVALLDVRFNNGTRTRECAAPFQLDVQFAVRERRPFLFEVASVEISSPPRFGRIIHGDAARNDVPRAITAQVQPSASDLERFHCCPALYRGFGSFPVKNPGRVGHLRLRPRYRPMEPLNLLSCLTTEAACH